MNVLELILDLEDENPSRLICVTIDGEKREVTATKLCYFEGRPAVELLVEGAPNYQEAILAH